MGSSPKAPPPPRYNSMDGQSFLDPNQAQERDRRIQLGSAFGYDQSAGNFDEWATAAPAEFRQYADQGLTAADYRAEQRMRQQANQAAQAENQRVDNTSAMRGSIDGAFSGFNDDYFNNISNSVLSFYNPQLDDQFKSTSDQLTFDLANRGLSRSSVAANKRTKLNEKYELEKGTIAQKAADAAQQARNDIASAKSRLYGMATSDADPGSINSMLTQETDRIRNRPPELTPLAQVFNDFVTPAGNLVAGGLAAESRGYQGLGTGIFDTPSKKSVVVKRS